MNISCCKCPSASADNEIEVLDSGPTNEFVEEEGAEDYEILDCKKIKFDLLCMRSVIEKYQTKLKGFLDVCPEETCIDYKTELSCSKNEEICNLQRSHYKLLCQIRELVDCCKVAKQELKTLHALICKKSEEIYALQKHTAALETWRRTLELEAGLCIERFEFLKNVKAEWSDVVDMLEKDKNCFKKMEEKFVPRKCYVKDKNYFISEIEKLKKMFRELYELRNARFLFDQSTDTPPFLSELNVAEKEYMTLKAKFNAIKYEKDGDEEEKDKDDCKLVAYTK